MGLWGTVRTFENLAGHSATSSSCSPPKRLAVPVRGRRQARGAGISRRGESNTAPVLTSDLAGTAGADHHPGYFRVSSNDLYGAVAVADFAYGELGLRRMAAVHDGDPYTTALVSAFGAAVRDRGIYDHRLPHRRCRPAPGGVSLRAVTVCRSLPGAHDCRLGSSFTAASRDFRPIRRSGARTTMLQTCFLCATRPPPSGRERQARLCERRSGADCVGDVITDRHPHGDVVVVHRPAEGPRDRIDLLVRTESQRTANQVETVLLDSTFRFRHFA